MKKSERLFSLVTLLASRRTAITAEAIADVMEVSIRTVYRDIQSLQHSGVTVEGEPGVGYMLGKKNHLPPLMFSPQQALALLIGSRMTQAFTDPELAKAAREAEEKIIAELPEMHKLRLEQQPYCIPLLYADEPHRQTHANLRKACENHTKLIVSYRDAKEQITQRTIWPLGMIGWFGKWTLLAWCEKRDAYRNFRFDRFEKIQYTQQQFEPTKTCSLQHYLSLVQDCK